MSDAKPADLTPEQYLNALKSQHDLYATAAHTLKTKPFFYEEFEGISKVVGFMDHMAKECRAQIEKIEPPKAKEKPAPYIVDVPPLAVETPDEPA